MKILKHLYSCHLWCLFSIFWCCRWKTAAIFEFCRAVKYYKVSMYQVSC